MGFAVFCLCSGSSSVSERNLFFSKRFWLGVFVIGYSGGEDGQMVDFMGWTVRPCLRAPLSIVSSFGSKLFVARLRMKGQREHLILSTMNVLKVWLLCPGRNKEREQRAESREQGVKSGVYKILYKFIYDII